MRVVAAATRRRHGPLRSSRVVAAAATRRPAQVSSKTTHLVAGELLDDGRPASASSKYVKAQNLGVAIISEAELREMLQG